MNEVKLLNIGGIDQNVKDQYARDIIAPSENGLDSTSNLPVASRHYDVGEFLIGQDRLYYEVLVEINVGDTLVVNSNIKATTVSDELVSLRSKSADAAIECIANMESTNLSVKAYEVGDYLYWQHGLDSGLYKVIADIAIGDALVINTNIKVSEPLANAVTELTRINNDFGVKNLLQVTDHSRTRMGVTFTVNPDYSISLSGSVEAGQTHSYMTINTGFMLPAGKYYLTGCYPNGGENTYRLIFTNMNTSQQYYDFGEGVEIVLDTDSLVYATIWINSGVVTDGMVFKPMIRPAYITDDTYEPYARSNQELTGEVEPMLNVLGAKNLLPNLASTRVINGVTFTVNSDGSISVTGKATATSVLYFSSDFYLPAGTYTLSGIPKVSDTTGKYQAGISYINGSDLSTPVRDRGANSDLATFNLASAANVMAYLSINNGETVNFLYQPMIRPASIKDDTYVPFISTNRDLMPVEYGKSTTFTYTNSQQYRTIITINNLKPGYYLVIAYGALTKSYDSVFNLRISSGNRTRMVRLSGLAGGGGVNIMPLYINDSDLKNVNLDIYDYIPGVTGVAINANLQCIRLGSTYL